MEAAPAVPDRPEHHDTPGPPAHPDHPAHPDPWPLAELVLRTPRLELRPDDDAGLRELVAVAHAGVHPPEEMPFAHPWTDADPRYLGRGAMQHFWSCRSRLHPEEWTVNLLVRRRADGRVLGVQSAVGTRFGVTREVSSGSWLGRCHQGRGYGTEMRAALLGWAFDHLGARTARSSAFRDNAASLAVSRRLGYREDGSAVEARRGRPAEQLRLRLNAADWPGHRPPWAVEVDGLDGCRALLGAG